MISSLNLTKDLRLPHLELFLKYSIKSSFDDKEHYISLGEEDNRLTSDETGRYESL